jgi:hypothetical protein
MEDARVNLNSLLLWDSSTPELIRFLLPSLGALYGFNRGLKGGFNQGHDGHDPEK